MTIKALVFDLDGTLAEFNLDFKTVRAEVKQFLVNQGFPASIFSINESIFEMLKKARVFVANAGRKEEEFDALRERVLSIANRHELEAARETSLMPGAMETLKALKEKDLKLAIFTINGRKSTNLILDTFHLRHFFDAIITREDVAKVKPDPSHLAAVLEQLNVQADDVVVVGDSVADIQSAKALNAAAVGIATDAAVAKKLNHAGATQIISSITDLQPAIAEMKQNKP